MEFRDEGEDLVRANLLPRVLKNAPVQARFSLQPKPRRKASTLDPSSAIA